jgi:ATP-dependent DNA helicase RecG
MTISLTTPIAEVPGVRPRHVEAFVRLGIRGVADLLRHLPMRYEQDLAEQDIRAAIRAVAASTGGRANVAVRGELDRVRFILGRKDRLEATLEDDTGSVQLTWFNALWMRDRLHPGLHIRAWGRARRHEGITQIVQPRWAAIDPDDPPARREARLRPVYPATEQLSSAMIDRAVESMLDPVLALLDDHLHEAYRSQRSLPALDEAYRMVHRPADETEASEGRRRLAFDELLLLQLGVMLKRRHRTATLQAIALAHSPAIDEHIVTRFPFELTPSQRKVIEEIAADLGRTVPMNRLLQGDVGSGKTVVALYAMLMAVASGHQAALMAPTELLAEQHERSIRAMLAGSSVTVELLTGSQPTAQRRSTLERLAAGEIELLIGTHALLTQDVAFESLAVAIVDEQHRFGVHQRATLRAKAEQEQSSPHVLVMTATPIPRTLSLTIFGDLDVSTITSPPPGRRPIITRRVGPEQREEVYGYLAGRLAGGDRAYIVLPVIEETASGLRDVESHHAWLRDGPLAAHRLGVVHGRLTREQREEVMQRFTDGTIDALIATTVIEVGVDVPEATIMIIEHAERFGLAQLHQLRGRVGRRDARGLCVLIAEATTNEAGSRLDAITDTADGFRIAERDLEIRGPGELFGSRQSGIAPFIAARLPEDLPLLRMARRDALLRRRLLKAHGAALGLGDVG